MLTSGLRVFDGGSGMQYAVGLLVCAFGLGDAASEAVRFGCEHQTTTSGAVPIAGAGGRAPGAVVVPALPASAAA